MAKAGTSQQLPNLSNYTAEGLVDICAPDQQEMNRLKKITDYYKIGLKARLTDSHILDPLTFKVEGESYTAIITKEFPNRFSLKIALEKGYITQEQIEECTLPPAEAQLTCRFYPK